MNENKDVAIRKHQAIAKANNMMFLSVAAASAVVGACLVAVAFLWQDVAFNQKVITAQDKSINNIKTSKENVEKLETSIANLQVDKNLTDTNEGKSTNALRLILDALPADANPAALYASLDKHILSDSNLKVESRRVDTDVVYPSTDKDSGQNSTVVSSGSGAQGVDPDEVISKKVGTIGFGFTVSAKNPDSQEGQNPVTVLSQVLERMESSLRAFKIKLFKLEQTTTGATLTVEGQVFFLPEYNLQLKNETIKSDEKKKANSGTKNGGTK